MISTYMYAVAFCIVNLILKKFILLLGSNCMHEYVQKLICKTKEDQALCNDRHILLLCWLYVGIWWLSDMGDSIYSSSHLLYGLSRWVQYNSWESLWFPEKFAGSLFLNFLQLESYEHFQKQISKLFSYLKVLHDLPNGKSFYRHRSKGSWTLSTADNGWSVPDCTGETLQVIQVCYHPPYSDSIKGYGS